MDMRGLHIVIVPSWWPSPEQPISGVFCTDYARAFLSAGAKVGVVFPDLISVRYLGRGTSIPWRPRVSIEDIAGGTVVRIRGVHTALGRPSVQMRRYRRWLDRGLRTYRERCGEPDVLHAMCAIPAGWACTHLDDPLARRVVVTEHTGPFSLVMTPRAGESYVRAALGEAAAVAAVSEPLRRDMSVAGIRRDIAIVSNPVSAAFAACAPPPVEQDASGRPVYRGVFVGRLTALKGVPELSEAAVALSDDSRFAVEWDVVGPGPLAGELRRRFASAGMGDRLKMHGYCEKSEVAGLIRASHFLVLPSHGENCPLAICEALSVGRPVVTTEADGCRALLDEAEGVLARVGDAGSLADAIARLLSDYAKWDWRSISARARDRFSGSAVARQYAKVFADVVNAVAGEPG